MKFSKFTPETVAELLVHLADHEKFQSLKGMKAISKSDVQNLLVELADQVRFASKSEPIVRKSQLTDKDLSKSTSQVISKLSPKEEEILLKSFRISE